MVERERPENEASSGPTPAGDARALARARERLLALHRVSTLVAGQRQSEDVVRAALRGAVSLLGADSGALFQFDADRQVLGLRESFRTYHGPAVTVMLESLAWSSASISR